MIYAIGDIHGQKQMLDRALSLIESDGGPNAEIVFVGDYTDRGPDSNGVIQTLLQGQQDGRNWIFLKGNHDRMFHDFVVHGTEHDPKVKSNISWVNPRLGGDTTLASYGIKGTPQFTQNDGDLERLTYMESGNETLTPEMVISLAQNMIPAAHLSFLNGLPLFHESSDLIFVHAGLRPNIPLHDQDTEDMLWIRDGFLETNHDFGKLVVHGHTAIDQPEHHGTRVNIDGGAGYGRPLVPVVFEGRDSWTLTEKGRVPLTSL